MLLHLPRLTPSSLQVLHGTAVCLPAVPCRDLLAEKVASVWTGGVEGRKGGYPTKKDRRERSESSGERCEGMFSQLPTLLWILRFKGLFFFFTLGEKGEEGEGQGTWGGLLARCSPGSEALHHPVNSVIIIPTALGEVLIPP